MLTKVERMVDSFDVCLKKLNNSIYDNQLCSAVQQE